MGEELGFVGCALVLVLFLMLGRARDSHRPRPTRIRSRACSRSGIGMSLFWYAALNLLVAVRLFPVTGLPLPFVSYGGSSLVSHLFELGILRNLARAGGGVAETAPRSLAGRATARTSEALL